MPDRLILQLAASLYPALLQQWFAAIGTRRGMWFVADEDVARRCARGEALKEAKALLAEWQTSLRAEREEYR